MIKVTNSSAFLHVNICKLIRYQITTSKGNPLKVKSVMTQSFTLKIIVLIWFVSIASNLPWIYLTEYTAIYFRDNGQFEYKCGLISKGDWTFSYMYVDINILCSSKFCIIKNEILNN